MLIGGICIILLLLVIILTVICFQRRSNSNKRLAQQNGYIVGRKYSSTPRNGAPDLWIQQQQQSRFATIDGNMIGNAISSDYILETAPVNELTRFVVGNQQMTVVESPPPRYQTLQSEFVLYKSFNFLNLTFF